MGSREVGSFIARRRKEKHWSQKELAGVLHVTDKAVSRWERGVGYPDVALLLPLAQALEVSVTEIMEGKYISEEEGNTVQAQQAVEHSVQYYMASSMEERKYLRKMILIQRIWTHVTVVFAFLFVVVMKDLVMPSVRVEVLCGYIFGFAMFAGILIQERVWSLAARYQVFASEEYRYEDGESNKDYGDYPKIGAAPIYLGIGKSAILIFAKNNGLETKLFSVFLWGCKVAALFAGFGFMLYGMYTARYLEDSLILFFFPFVTAAVALLLGGACGYIRGRTDVEEKKEGKRQMIAGVCVAAAGVLLLLLALLFSWLEMIF